MNNRSTHAKVAVFVFGAEEHTLRCSARARATAGPLRKALNSPFGFVRKMMALPWLKYGRAVVRKVHAALVIGCLALRHRILTLCLGVDVRNSSDAHADTKANAHARTQTRMRGVPPASPFDVCHMHVPLYTAAPMQLYALAGSM